MVHYTCDQCGKELRPDDAPRYVVKIEAFAAHDPAELTEADLETDHLEAISEELRDLEDGETVDLPPPAAQFRYDLCADCHRRYVRDPLGKTHPQKIVFNKN